MSSFEVLIQVTSTYSLNRFSITVTVSRDEIVKEPLVTIFAVFGRQLASNPPAVFVRYQRDGSDENCFLGVITELQPPLVVLFNVFKEGCHFIFVDFLSVSHPVDATADDTDVLLPVCASILLTSVPCLDALIELIEMFPLVDNLSTTLNELRRGITGVKSRL